MPKYDIPVSWTMWKTIRVEANNIIEAINKAEADKSTDQEEGEYLSDSLKVDEELIEEFNELSERDKILIDN